jgi:ribonuclease J
LRATYAVELQINLSQLQNYNKINKTKPYMKFFSKNDNGSNANMPSARPITPNRINNTNAAPAPRREWTDRSTRRTGAPMAPGANNAAPIQGGNPNQANRPRRSPNWGRNPRNGQGTPNNNQNRGPRGGFNPNNRGPRNHGRPANQVFHTATALNWGNNNTYQFKADDTNARVKIIPIGGVEQVGVNCTVIEYENDIIIIDAGLGFDSNQEYPGIDALVPNLEYLYDRKDKIRGLVITHGHTDHIGGIHHIIDKIGFPPIYAPRLAAGLLREKMKETTFGNNLKINEIDGDSTYYLGKFHISHFKMTHSIPDNYGIAINTPVGRIVTPSDYKFDNSPYKESTSDYSKLAKLGDEGVLVLLSESTYAKVRGWAPSESTIAEDIENVIRTAESRLIIGMFSTMVNRMRQVVEIAAKYNKKIAVLGRSIENQIKISHELGYMDVANSVFVPFDQITKIPDDQLVIITTGSQGEENAALMRMAKGEHQKITLKQNDTIVFSSSRIPGNEGKIDKLINLLTQRGAKIITNDYMSLHTTGHGHQEDMKLLLRLLKPKNLLPIHGEPSMLVAHKNLAMEMGYAEENIIVTQNGAVVELNQEGWQIKEKVDAKPLWVEGNRIGDFDPEIITERTLLTDEGVVVVSIKNAENASFGAGDVEVIHKGFFVQKSDDFIYKKLIPSIIATTQSAPDKERETIKAIVKRHIETELKKQYEKVPMVIVSVL